MECREVHELLSALELGELAGESCVLRLLDGLDVVPRVDELFSDAKLAARVLELARRPHGLFVVAGPTGSGKTTTLYSLTAGRDVEAEKVVTIEDPVELLLPGVQQMAVDTSVGFGFPKALRAALRSDPDVLMCGEVRDADTAQILLQCALVGHQVFTCIHANDAVGALLRLVDAGLERSLLADCGLVVLAQRLVRRLRPVCRRPEPSGATPEALAYRAVGCDRCTGGYRGRLAVNELLVVGPSLRPALVAGADSDVLRETARDDGMGTLVECGMDLVRTGATTPEEVRRLARGLA